MRESLSNKNQDILNQYEITIQNKEIENKNSVFINPAVDFLLWVEQRGIFDIKELDKDPQLIVDYIDYLKIRPNKKTGNPLSKSMVVKLRYAVAVFVEDLYKQKVLKKNYYSRKRVKNEYIGRTPFTHEEIKQLYDACTTKLERMIIHLAYSFGMRRSEIIKLNHDEVEFDKGYLVVRKGKKFKRREVFNPDKILADLKDYLITDRQEELVNSGMYLQESFLVNSKGKRIDKGNLAVKFKAILNRSDVQRGGSLHDLRASIISHLLEAGMAMDKVQKFAGHSNIDTVHLYAMKRKLYQNLNIAA